MATARKTPTNKNAMPPKAAVPALSAATPAAATAPESSKASATQSPSSESSANLVERYYIVQDSLHLDGKAYQVGDPITLTEDQLEKLPAGIVLAAEG